MYIITLDVSPEEKYQIFTINAEVAGVARRLRIELRYLEVNEKWYVSVFDAQSGENFCRYVPVVASYQEPVNNILAPYKYKGIGGIVCIPAIKDPSTEDPKFENISEFLIIWGDSID